MIVSDRPLTSSPRWATALIAILAAAFLPLGVTQAQEPDYEAVANRLLEAVEEGELSPDQAESMMGELARRRFKQRLEALEVEEEEDDDRDHDDARITWEKIAKGFGHLGMKRKEFDGMVKRLVATGMQKPQFVPTLGGMLKLVHVLHGADGALDKDTTHGFSTYFKAQGLSGEQTKIVWGIAKKLAARKGKPHDHAKGPSDDAMAAVKKKIWDAVEAGKLSEADAKEKWNAYANKAHRKGRDKGGKLVVEFKRLGVDPHLLGKVKTVLLEAGVRAEALEPTLGAMLKVVHAAKEQGDAFTLDPRLRQQFAETVGLTDAQVERVVALSRRLAHSAKRPSKQY